MDGRYLFENLIFAQFNLQFMHMESHHSMSIAKSKVPNFCHIGASLVLCNKEHKHSESHAL